MKEKFKEFFIFIEMTISCIWLSIPFVRRYYDKKEERFINNLIKLSEELIDAGIQIEDESKRRESYFRTAIKNTLE